MIICFRSLNVYTSYVIWFISKQHTTTYQLSNIFRVQFHYNLVRLKFNPKVNWQKCIYMYVRLNLSGMLKVEHIVHKHQLYLLEQHSESFWNFGQTLLGLTLKVNSWLWNWAPGRILLDRYNSKGCTCRSKDSCTVTTLFKTWFCSHILTHTQKPSAYRTHLF